MGVKNMVFYKIDAVMVGNAEKEEKSRQEQKARANDIAEKSEGFFQKSDQNILMFVVSILDTRITLGCISKGNENINDVLAKYVKLLPFEIEKIKVEEITFSALQALLSCAGRNEYIGDDTDVLEVFEISSLMPRYSDTDFGEALVNTNKSKTDLEETAENLLFGGTMLPEIERIYQTSTLKNASGHPVHYIVQTNDRDVRKSIYKNLLSSISSYFPDKIFSTSFKTSSILTN